MSSLTPGFKFGGQVLHALFSLSSSFLLGMLYMPVNWKEECLFVSVSGSCPEFRLYSTSCPVAACIGTGGNWQVQQDLII